MKEILTKLVQQDKRRQILYTIAAAATIALLILSVSYGIRYIIDTSDTNDIGNEENDNQNQVNDDYVIGLSSKLDADFQQDNIVRFSIAGNITPSIHERLIHSDLTPHPDYDNRWLVEAFVLNETTLDPKHPYKTNFTFTDTQMYETHTSFLDALNSTIEVNETELPDISGSVPNLLFYRVLFTDNTMLDFEWVGFEDVNIMVVSHYTWDGYVKTPSFYFEEEHYLSPLSAFDPFISQLQLIYGNVLNT